MPVVHFVLFAARYAIRMTSDAVIRDGAEVDDWRFIAGGGVDFDRRGCIPVIEKIVLKQVVNSVELVEKVNTGRHVVQLEIHCNPHDTKSDAKDYHKYKDTDSIAIDSEKEMTEVPISRYQSIADESDNSDIEQRCFTCRKLDVKDLLP